MTTIKAFAARLDDYTGSLSQAVEKLEIERDRGVLNRDEQMDLVGDLRQAVRERLIRPWRRRAATALILGLFLLVAAFLLPSTWPQILLLRWAAAGLGVLLLAWGGYGAGKAHHYRHLECVWLRDMEAAVQMGGTVFDIH
jgi:hypothetical protein